MPDVYLRRTPQGWVFLGASLGMPTVLILFTFTVLSFTSVKSYLRSNDIRLAHRPAYPGLMIRDRAWFSLEEPTAMLI